MENAGDRWGVSEGEVKARRRFLDRAKGQVEVSGVMLLDPGGSCIGTTSCGGPTACTLGLGLEDLVR